MRKENFSDYPRGISGRKREQILPYHEIVRKHFERFLNNKVVFLQVCGCQFDKDPSPERKITLLETVMAIQRNEKDGE